MESKNQESARAFTSREELLLCAADLEHVIESLEDASTIALMACKSEMTDEHGRAFARTLLHLILSAHDSLRACTDDVERLAKAPAPKEG